jgi:dinuclear metal center YbgI/SA1388 family protein
MPSVADLAEFLNDFAPPRLAGDWDNVGLLLGDGGREVRRVMTCLTVTPESAAEAVEEHADLIVSHHPILFRPVQRLTSASAEGRMVLSLAAAKVAVYSPHTAFDNTRDGINDILAARLGLAEITPLRRRAGEAQCKLVVFVPEKDVAGVSAALFEAGAGRIGQYRECSFRTGGTGTFFGEESSHPTVGAKGRREEVAELRLEVICPESLVDPIIAAMRSAHSYEEPAYDVYPLRPMLSRFGEGRLGVLPRPTTLAELAGIVRATLHADLVQVVGDRERSVRRIAIACGAGGTFLRDAVRYEAEVFLTGEMRFHDYLAAQADEMALILPGHYASERPGIEALAERIQRQWSGLTVWASKREHDPAWHV